MPNNKLPACVFCKKLIIITLRSRLFPPIFKATYCSSAASVIMFKTLENTWRIAEVMQKQNEYVRVTNQGNSNNKNSQKTSVWHRLLMHRKMCQKHRIMSGFAAPGTATCSSQGSRVTTITTKTHFSMRWKEGKNPTTQWSILVAHYFALPNCYLNFKQK